MDLKKTRLIGFSVGNFRVFKDEDYFDFAPITILTGTNNSGKSSLIKAIRLFSTSIKLNNGLYLDFTDADLKLGSFNQVKNHYNKDNDDIDFGFRIEIENEDSSKTVYTFLSSYNQNGLSSFYVSIDGERYIEVVGKRDGKNFQYISSFIALPYSILNLEKLKKKLNHLSDESFNKIKNEIITFLEKNNEMHVSDSSLYKNILIQNNHPLYNVIEAIYYALENAASNNIKPIFEEILSDEHKDIVDETFRKEYVSDFINNFIDKPDFIPQNLFSCFLNADILESIRAEQSVLFRDIDNPNLIETFRGYKNLLIYDNLSAEEIVEKDFDKVMDIASSNTKKYFTAQWLTEFGIIGKGDQLQIDPISAPGYYEVSIKKQNGETMHLTELGYGFTQIIPIILKICMSENKTIIIEEPESNLHPALQSKLADLFVDATKHHGIQFIIETHSEYLIRRLQYLTVKTDSDLNPQDTVIYYFYPPDKIPGNQSQIKRIKIQPDGSLTNEFGTGFFDEADNIALDIFLLKNSQKN